MKAKTEMKELFEIVEEAALRFLVLLRRDRLRDEFGKSLQKSNELKLKSILKLKWLKLL